MKIAYITPGSGGTFYCQNCYRDDDLLTSLSLQGHDVQKVPMYLPANLDGSEGISNSPVFYGAINVYLREKLPFYRQAPDWMEKIFDSQKLLQIAAKKSGSTRASGLEDMTMSMLQGEDGHQAEELEHLVRYLRDEVRPDVIHLSNALLLGLARRLKQEVSAIIVCSLQDENEWVDLMEEDFQRRVWDLMAKRGEDVDLFITSSRYYADRCREVLHIPDKKMEIIPGGINCRGYEASPLPFHPPAVGYMCRMSEYFGLGILVKAWIRLRKESRFKNVRLHLTGGYTGDDKKYVTRLLREAERHQMHGDIHIWKDFSKSQRIQFLKSLTLLSVPVPVGEAFGAYQYEALAAGVPVVQPNVGCYPEFIEATGGGVIYEPNTPERLSEEMARLLNTPERIRKMAADGRKVVLERFCIQDTARQMTDSYRKTMESETSQKGESQ